MVRLYSITNSYTSYERLYLHRASIFKLFRINLAFSNFVYGLIIPFPIRIFGNLEKLNFFPSFKITLKISCRLSVSPNFQVFGINLSFCNFVFDFILLISRTLLLIFFNFSIFSWFSKKTYA